MKNSSKPWADQPLPLVETPFHATKETDVYTQGASQMALLHNAILRGFNTIYLQAPHVQPKDYRDFIGYSLTWCKFVKKHHDDEEARLFPSVESAMGVIGALDHSREEHHTFMHGLTKFNTYLASLFNANRTAEFSGARLVSIMDSFKKAFCHHFHHEIDHIADLRDLTEAICAERTAEVGAIFAAWGRNSIRGVGVSDIFSFILMNFDRTAENGIWKDWPPNMPAPIRWILINVGGAWNSNYWKFSSCTSDGRPRTLYALRDLPTGGDNSINNNDNNNNNSSIERDTNTSSSSAGTASSRRGTRKANSRARRILSSRRSSREKKGPSSDLMEGNSSGLLSLPASLASVRAS